jgi:1,4-dihydroxy-6-naphthoate synthase
MRDDPRTVRDLAFGFSPCPNDTFAFWAAVHGKVPTPGFRLLPDMRDIEQLNARAVTGNEALPITKLSLPAMAAVADRYAALPAGAALGFGCGPLVVARQDGPRTIADLRRRRVAIPGCHTTAFLLFAIFQGLDCDFVPLRFDQIIKAVAGGDVDAGLVIHESRFTYRSHGLVALADLGELWERATSGPLPLAVIAARRDLSAALVRDVGAALRASVELARAQPELPRAFVRQHSQEIDDAVCDQHIALYVNEFSVELGERGRMAIDQLLQRGRAAGLLADRGPVWRQ